MIHCDGQVLASQDEVSCFVQCICYCQRFTFDWCVSGFSGVCESAAHQGDLPTLFAAEEVVGGAGAVFLEQPVTDAMF